MPMATNIFLLCTILAFLFAPFVLAQSPPAPDHTPTPSPQPLADSPIFSPPSPSPSSSPSPETGSPIPVPLNSPSLSPPAPSAPGSAPAPVNSLENSPSPSPSPAPAPEEAGDVDHVDNVAAGGDESEGSSGMSGGKKAGIAVGVIAAACLVGLAGMVYKKRQNNLRRSQYGYAARRELL